MSRGTVAEWAALIRVSHSVFALPFALLALLAATGGAPGARLLVLVVLAAVSARAAAMAYNRYVDRRIDAANPRTARRELPRGAIRPGAALAFALGCGALFLATAWAIAPVCGLLGVPTLALLYGYSHAKRFTALCHLWLGLALGLAAPAAHVAARGAVDATVLPALVLGAAVLAWVAGFDVLYATQDEDFDRAHGLHSIPARLGQHGALRLARGLHAGAVAGFAGYGVAAGAGPGFALALGAAALFLLWQHLRLRAGGLAGLDGTFFTLNGVVGILLLAGTAADLYLLRA